MKSVAPCLMLVLIPFALDVPVQSAYESSVPPPTLTGERFTGTITSLSGTCNRGNANVSFDSAGVASGPYAGSYSAHMTLSSEFFTTTPYEFQQPFATATVVAFESEITTLTETFEIRDAAGELLVSGTKSLSLPGEFECADSFSETSIIGSSTGLLGVFRTVFAPSLSYEASIFTPSGTYHDRGQSGVGAQAIALVGGVIVYNFNVFGEGFTSSLSTPSRGVPTSHDDCKDDGWIDRTRADGTPFRNQGDCVQYVETGRTTDS